MINGRMKNDEFARQLGLTSNGSALVETMSEDEGLTTGIVINGIEEPAAWANPDVPETARCGSAG